MCFQQATYFKARPDIAVVCADSVYVLDLTVCHEINMIRSHDYNKNKYKDIGHYGSTVAGNRKIVPHFIEVSTLGFIADIYQILLKL